MRHLFIIACLLATSYSFSQGKTLYKVTVVKPKAAFKTAFETSWKAHALKFHNKDHQVRVYEIVSGERAGSYQIVEGPFAYSDMDKVMPNKAAHDLDLENALASKLESVQGPYFYAHRDTLSFNSSVRSNNAIVTATHVKNGKMNDYLREVRRTAIIADSVAPFGVNAYVQILSGSDPTIVTVRSLKDGYKELEANYFNRPANEFRDAYIKAYSQQDWDKRNEVMNNEINSRTVFFTSYRSDLSTVK